MLSVILSRKFHLKWPIQDSGWARAKKCFPQKLSQMFHISLRLIKPASSDTLFLVRMLLYNFNRCRLGLFLTLVDRYSHMKHFVTNTRYFYVCDNQSFLLPLEPIATTHTLKILIYQFFPEWVSSDMNFILNFMVMG